MTKEKLFSNDASRSWKNLSSRLLFAVWVVSGLAGCSSLTPADFARTEPHFNPATFFTGRTHSWGVFENRAGEPARRFTTDAVGTRERDGTLALQQAFTYEDGTVQHRRWRIRQLDAHRFEATANDVVGTARGEAYGNAFHWEYTVALKPGNSLYDVQLKQWMYLQAGGATMMNRATVHKFGLRVAQVTEFFRREPAGANRQRQPE